MKFFMFRDKDRIEVMMNINQISSISVNMNGVVRVIATNGGYYEYPLPDHYKLNRDVYIKKIYNAIRRKSTNNSETFVITEKDIDEETITTI